jgi:hypothetical protein
MDAQAWNQKAIRAVYVMHRAGRVHPETFLPGIQPLRNPMKKILLAVALAVGAMSATAPVFAYDNDHRPMVRKHHHRPICHNVRYHGHWVKRCR